MSATVVPADVAKTLAVLSDTVLAARVEGQRTSNARWWTTLGDVAWRTRPPLEAGYTTHDGGWCAYSRKGLERKARAAPGHTTAYDLVGPRAHREVYVKRLVAYARHTVRARDARGRGDTQKALRWEHRAERCFRRIPMDLSW